MSRANPATTHPNAGIPATSFIKAKAEVRSYEQAVQFLGNQESRELASNVTVVVVKGSLPHPEAVGIQLYQTVICTYFKDGTFTVDNGGWNTPTTSTRLNQFGPKGWFFYHNKKKLHGYRQSGGTGLYEFGSRKITFGGNRPSVNP